MNAIIGFSEMIKEEAVGALSDKQKEYIGYVWSSGKHLLSLINDILDLSKVEAGKMELHLGACDLNAVAQGSLSLFKEHAMKHRLELSAMVEEGFTSIQADEKRIKQILFNLLSNASKFTPDGGKIGIEVTRRGDGEALISVWDTGIGIEPKDHHKIFQEFQQIDSSYSRKYAGTGLGLSLTKRFVELHGGAMWFESAGQDHGTRFHFTLPLNGPVPQQEATPPPGAPPQSGGRPDASSVGAVPPLATATGGGATPTANA
jgi:signal transduction histidine kinase